MRIIFHYKSHLLRPKSHKRCPLKKLWFENIWNKYFVKKFKTSHPNLLILNGDNQSPTHKHDWVIESVCEEIIPFFHFLHNGIHISRYNLHCTQYLIYHPRQGTSPQYLNRYLDLVVWYSAFIKLNQIINR